jgi:coenzyme PQQ precursor peptide PqqA
MHRLAKARRLQHMWTKPKFEVVQLSMEVTTYIYNR